MANAPVAEDPKEGRARVTIGALAAASRQRPLEEAVPKVVQKPLEKKTSGDKEVPNGDRVKISGSVLETERPQKGSKDSGSSQAAKAAKPASVDVFKSAVSKVNQTKRFTALQQQMQEDLRTAHSWNQQLQNPANRNNADICERFWAEMKMRIIRRYGSIAACFRQVDTSGDGSISFLEFVDMLRVIHLPLEMRVARSMFDKASCGDRELSLGELKALLMEKTIQKLQSTMRGFNKKQERVRKHVHSFMKYLARASHMTMIRSVDRLQRKLTIPFCKEFWKMLRDHLARIHSDGDLERSAFAQVVHNAIGTHFMAYETAFLLRIFDRVDKHKRGCIQLRDLMTTLVLVSEDKSKEEKLEFLFEVFDTDFDGCLLYDQILGMIRCICAHRPLVEKSTLTATTNNDNGFTFQSELTAQDGLRLYECLFWYLQRTTKLDSDIVTWKELWKAFEQQPQVASAVLPGLLRIHWVLEHSAHGEPDNDVAAHDASSFDQADGLLGTAAGAAAERGAHPRKSPMRVDEEGSRTSVTSAGEQRGAAVGNAPEMPEKTSRDPASRRAAGFIPQEECDKTTRATIRATIFGKPKPEIQSVAAWETQPRETTATFKRAVTNRFLSSLRNLGDVRCTELVEGFRIAEELAAGGPRDVAPDASLDDIDDGGRPVSTASSQAARPGSSPKASGGKGLGLIGAAKGGAAPMPRVASAPTGLLEKPRGVQLAANASAGALGADAARPKSSQSGVNARIPSSAELPTIGSQRWGLEAADRFRLFSTVRSSRNNQRHLIGSCASTGPCGSADGMGYKCQVCHRQHMMLTSF